MTKLPTSPDAPPTLAVIYGAKSSADRRRSIGTQHEDAREKCADEGWEIRGRAFSDDGFSAYSGNRGPDLAAAIDFAAELAEQEGRPVMLVTQACDRFARGAGDAPGAAQHLSELWHRARRVNVHLRTLEDDDDTRDAATIAGAGERAMRESRRKSRAVTKGIKRAAERGDWLGGREPDGYRKVPREEGKPRLLELDPERAPTISRALQLGLDGFNAGETSRELNAEGLRRGQRRRDGTVELREWTSRRVAQTSRQAHYAGLANLHGKILVNDDGTPIMGNWPRLIEPDHWFRLQAILEARADAMQTRGRGGNVTGRGSTRHLLTRICTCGVCGAPVWAFGDSQRKDGSVPRRLQCSASRLSNGTCSAPRFDAAVIERPVVRNLMALTVDLDGWVERRRGELSAAREAWDARAEHERAELLRLDRLIAKAREDYLRYLETDANAAAEFADVMAGLRLRRRQAEARLSEHEAAAAATPAEPDHHALLDLYSDLQRALAGHVVGATVREVNARLRESLDHIELTPSAGGGVTVRAFLAPAFLATLECDPAAFAAVSEMNGGPPVEHGPGGTLARLDVPPPGRAEVGDAHPSCTTSR